MSFLSAAFLFALPLVAAPVAIHLYRGRQRDVVMWGAMQFLAAAATKGRRMERLEEWLLMAVRAAAVVALVLALARPTIRNSLFGEIADREVILILDDSLSMSRDAGGESSADRLKTKAIELVDSLAEGDAVQVLLASGHEWATAEPILADSAGRRRLNEIIDATESTLGSAALLDCLQEAIHLDGEGEISQRRIVVLTDGQASSWQMDAAASWRQLAADREAASVPISIEVVDCGHPAPVENLAVHDVRASDTLIRPGGVAELTASIGNVGDASVEASQLEWLVNDKVEQVMLLAAIKPHTTTDVLARLTLPEAGRFVVTCRIKRLDQVPLDQENHVVVEATEQLPILLVAGGDSRDGAVATHTLLSAALGYKNGEPQDWHSAYRPEVIEPVALPTHSLAEYRAILINNPESLRGEALERLDAYVRAGGGLWVALGDNADRSAFNRDWYSDGDGLSPSAIESLRVIEKPEDIAATVHPPSRDHPATLQLANTTQLDIDEARVQQRWRFAERPAAADGGFVSALLESGNGEPLVVEKHVGHGRVLIQSFPLGLEWSNFPLLKAYVVMVHDWLNYVSAPRASRYNLPLGGAIVAAAPTGAGDTSARLLSPRGRELPLLAVHEDIAPQFRYTHTRLPGVYRVLIEGAGMAREEVPFHVAREASESNFQRLNEADRTALLDGAGIAFTEGEPMVAQMAAYSARREPFWGALLTALVALLLVELLISHWVSQHRGRMAVNTI